MLIKDQAARNRRVLATLGMPFGTACGRLRKALLFSLASRLDLCWCFRCQKRIATVDEFSIEHKEDWEYSHDAKRLFFDLGNIAFSHHGCNVGAARKRTYPSAKARRDAKYLRMRNDQRRYDLHLETKKRSYRRRKRKVVAVEGFEPSSPGV